MSWNGFGQGIFHIPTKEAHMQAMTVETIPLMNLHRTLRNIEPQLSRIEMHPMEAVKVKHLHFPHFLAQDLQTMIHL
jgi:hypothetical protein